MFQIEPHRKFYSIVKGLFDTPYSSYLLPCLSTLKAVILIHANRIPRSNHRERLDAALLRPGRIDQQVRFTLATRAQARELFVRMYQPIRRSTDADPTDADAGEERCGPSEKGEKGAGAEREGPKSNEMAIDPARVEATAAAFAEACPSETFSPAEIQGYLLTKKHDPEGAVAGAGAWVEEAMKKKKEETEE